MVSAQALQRRYDVLLIHFHRVGDHTRGLFEADASIVASAAHARENVKIFFLVSHGFVLTNRRLRSHSGKTYFLRCDRFGLGLRFPVVGHDKSNPNENSPRLAQPDHVKNDESIFRH